MIGSKAKLAMVRKWLIDGMMRDLHAPEYSDPSALPPAARFVGSSTWDIEKEKYKELEDKTAIVRLAVQAMDLVEGQ